MIEDAILKWVLTVGIPLASFIMMFFTKTKENERRLTIIEANQRHVDEKLKDYTLRLSTVENNYKVLVRMEEQLKTLFKQNEEIKDDIKVVKTKKLKNNE